LLSASPVFAAPFVAARERRMPLLLIASFAVVWYAVHEATPLKPFPNFSRYMLPFAPLVMILGASFIYEIAARWDHRGILAVIVLALAGAIDVRLDQCTRCRSARASGARVIFDRNRRILDIRFRPTKDMADIVVTAESRL
jgi:hypothetical protein